MNETIGRYNPISSEILKDESIVGALVNTNQAATTTKNKEKMMLRIPSLNCNERFLNMKIETSEISPPRMHNTKSAV